MYILLWMVGVIICFSLLLITSCLVLLKYFTMFQLTLFKRLRCCGIRDKKHWEISNFFLDCAVNSGFKIKQGSWFFSRIAFLTMTFFMTMWLWYYIIYTLPAYLTYNSTWKSTEELGHADCLSRRIYHSIIQMRLVGNFHQVSKNGAQFQYIFIA